jgi:transcriptional regulator
MYRTPAFTEDDVTVLVALARTAGFGHLVVSTADGLLSTPVPFVIADDGGRVRMHLARPNAVWKAAPCGALLIVPVSDAYVSPGWYPSKAEHGKVVPTWNYEIVQVHGQLVAHDDVDWVRTQIDDLTALNESRLAQPWATTDAPAEFVDAMQRGIVGIELVVDRLEGKRKLSQNRPDADRAGAVEGMEAAGLRGAAAASAAMRHLP